MKKLVNFFTFALLAILSIVAIDTELPENKILILKHCKMVADKVNLGDVRFNLDKDVYLEGKANGRYDSSSGTIWLSPQAQKKLLFNIKTKNPALTYADFTLLHELGHYEDFMNFRTLTKSALVKGAAKETIIDIFSFISSNLPADLSNVSLILKDLNQLIGCKRLSPQSISYSRECYADQFATTKLCEIHGFEKTKEYLRKRDIYRLHTKHFLNGEGYQHPESLLKIIEKLEKEKRISNKAN